MEIAVLVGVPGSGKTEFYRRHLAGTHEHVSMDLLGHGGNVRRKEQRRIEEALAAGRNVAVDNTNVTRETRLRYFELGRAHGAEMVAYFFDESLDACLRRNAGRTGVARVPDAAVRSFHARLEPPSRDEGFDRAYRVSVTDGGFRVEEVCRGGVVEGPVRAGEASDVDAPERSEGQ